MIWPLQMQTTRNVSLAFGVPAAGNYCGLQAFGKGA